MPNVEQIRYKKPRKQIPSSNTQAKSVCVTTYPDTLENYIKIYIDLGYQVIVSSNHRNNVKVYMEKL